MNKAKFKKSQSILVVALLIFVAFLLSIDTFQKTYAEVSLFCTSLVNSLLLNGTKLENSYNAVGKKKPLVVLLVSQCRSGSSVLGELFNQRSKVTYLYEPLYPLRTRNGVQPPRELLNTTKKCVESIAHCKFTELPHYYR